MAKTLDIYEAVLRGWRIFKINFTDESHEIIASFISSKALIESRTYLVTCCVLTRRIDDEKQSFCYEQYFGKKLNGLIEDITDEWRSKTKCN